MSDGVPPLAASWSATPRSATDETCSTESLLQYYNDCAEFYDETEPGEEDTYICVDRVTQSIVRRFAYNARAPLHHHLASPVPTRPSPTASPALPENDSSPSSPSSPASPRFVADSSNNNNNHSSSSSSPASPSPVESLDSPRSMPSSASRSDLTATPSQSEQLQTMSYSLSLSSSSSSASSPSHQGSSSVTSSLTSSPMLRLPSSFSPLSSSFSSSAELLHAYSLPLSYRMGSPLPLKILDLGVGTGLASRPLFSQLSQPRLHVPRKSTHGEKQLQVPQGTIVPEIWGVDLSPNMLKVSSVLPFRHLIAGDLNTHLSKVVDSPLCDTKNYFDVVVCVGTTEFVRDYKFFFEQVSEFLVQNGGLFCGTFPSNQTRTYPGMNWTDCDSVAKYAKEIAGLTVLDVQQYRGWSVSSEEHVEYIQILAQSTGALAKNSDAAQTASS